MKKIFTLMWAVVCAALTIVSCTPDTPGDDPQGPTYTSAITVTGAPEANLAPEAGELSLSYAIENPTLTDALVVTTEAAWVKVGEIGEATVALTYEANTDAPGSPAREAVIKFAYKGAEDVLVTLKQDSAEPTFTVEFTECTPNSAIALLKSADQEMDWLALAVASSSFADFGATTPAEYIAALCNEAASMGFPYLFLVNQLYSNSGSMGKGTPTEPFMVMKGWQAKPEDKLYLFVLGYNVDADLNMWEYDNSTLATPAHIFEVPLLPAPSLTIAEDQLSQNVSAAAGQVVVDYVLENAVEGVAVEAWTEATWLTPSCADGKLTIAYEANTAAVARRAVVSVGYGDLQAIELTVVQEKDANAVAITLNVEVTGTAFNGIWVNITPSDKDVTYAMNYQAVEKDWETGAELETDWMKVSENLLSYTGNATFHKGDLTNYFIKMNPSNYEWYGLDYYVYAVAVEATSEETTDWQGNPKTNWTVNQILSDVSYAKTTIDVSKMPSLEWDLTKNPELVWNANADRYDLEVVEGSTVVLNFIVNNPAEGAFLALNSTSGLYDNNNVVDGEPVIDNAAGTITLKIDKFDTAKSYHYIQPTFKYTNAEGDTWGITTPSLRLTQVEKPGMQLPYEETFADSIGNFTINNVDIDGLSYVWKHDAQYKQMKASAFVSNVKHATETWLVSPKIDLSTATMPGLQFSHTHKFAGTPAEELTLWVKEWGAAEWTQVTIPTYGTNNDWTFVTAAVDLSAWAGKKVQIGFKYTSTTSAAATWEIKNVVVYDAGGAAAPLM